MEIKDWIQIITVLVTGVLSFLAWQESKKNREENKGISLRKIDADLIAKARIDWIREVRELSADFLMNAYNYSSNHELNFDFISQFDISPEEQISAYYVRDFEYMESIYDNLFLSYQKIVLFFPKTDNLNRNCTLSNKDVINSMEEAFNSIKSLRCFFYVNDRIKTSFEKNMKYFNGDSFFEGYLDDFQEKITAYLKCEWERAKQVE